MAEKYRVATLDENNNLDLLGVVSSDSPRAAPAPPRQLNVLGVGLSIMNFNTIVPGQAVQSINPAGFLNWANFFLGGRLNFVTGASAKICGISGAPSGPASDNTTSSGSGAGAGNGSLLNRISNPDDYYYALGLDPAPDIIFAQIDSGDDSTAVFSLAQSATYLTAILDLLRTTYPTAVMWMTTLPGTSQGGNAARRAYINPILRAYAQTNNVKLLDYEAITTDFSTGLPIAGQSIDTIHPNAIGAMRVGRFIAREFGPYVPQGSMLIPDAANDSRVQSAGGGWGSAALLATGGGFDFSVTAASSGIANGFSNSVSDQAGSQWSLVPRSDGKGNWQRMMLPSGLTSAGKVSLTRSAGALPAGAVVYAEAEFRTHGDWVGAVDFGLEITTNLGVGCNSTALVAFGTSYGPPSEPGAGVRGVLQTAPIVIPTGGVTSANVTAYLQAIAGSLDVSRPSFVRVS